MFCPQSGSADSLSRARSQSMLTESMMMQSSPNQPTYPPTEPIYPITVTTLHGGASQRHIFWKLPIARCTHGFCHQSSRLLSSPLSRKGRGAGSNFPFRASLCVSNNNKKIILAAAVCRKHLCWCVLSVLLSTLNTQHPCYTLSTFLCVS